MATWRDEFELLCERCGYPLGDAGGAGVCPECGLAREASLPSNRRGTPFQRRARPDGVLPTVRMVLLEPGVAWTVVRPVWWESWRLGLWLLGLTGMCVGIGLVGLLVELPPSATRGGAGLPLILGTLAGVPVFIVLFLMARASEFVLERLWGPARGRLDRAGSVTVVAHALSALLVSGLVLGSVGLANAFPLVAVPRPRLVAAALGVGGLLWYAMLLRRGARELRYANRLRQWVEPDGGAG